MKSYETKDYAEQVMSHLSEKDVELLKMRYWHEMKFREIGEEFGLGTQSVNQKLLLLLKKIRKYVVPKLDKKLLLN